MLAFFRRCLGLPPLRLNFSGRTDTGCVRDHNEDSLAMTDKRRLFIVADGMGGHNAGEVASKLAIDSILDFISQEQLNQVRGNDEAIRALLLASFHHANREVMAKAAGDAQLTGMGTTMVACLLDGNRLHVCHVGDARCYVAHRKKLRQITTDHSATSQVGGDDETGPLRVRQVVTRAMGFPFPEDPEYHREIMRTGDRILLCSDGLWNMVDNTRIEQILVSAASPEEACELLVNAANDEGGRDNITALVIFF